MPTDKKITDLTELKTPADGDFIPIVDVSDLTDDSAGTSKKITRLNLTPTITLPALCYLNVKDYGAVGDGMTDDTSAINAAIAAVVAQSSVGGTVFFPQGDYLVSSTITLPTGIRLMSIGMTRGRIFGSINGFILNTALIAGQSPSSYYQAIEDIQIVNTNTGASAGVIQFNNASDIYMKRVYLNGVKNYLVDVHESHTITFQDCYLNGAGANWGVHLGARSNIMRFYNNTFENSMGGIVGSFGGFTFDAIGNHFEGLVGGSVPEGAEAACIFLDNGWMGGVIEGNYVESCNCIGFEFQYDGLNYGFTIGGNFMNNVLNHFMYFDGLCNSTINSNYFAPDALSVNADGVFLASHSTNNVTMPQKMASGIGAVYSDAGTNNTKIGTW